MFGFCKQYSDKVYRDLGIAAPSWRPETRWPTSGVESWIYSPDIRSGALDRMWSGVQKESPYNMGPGTLNLFRFTGAVTTGGTNPDSNQMVPYRTARALQDSNQGQYAYPSGPMISDMAYAATYANAQGTPQGIVSRLMRAIGRQS